MSGHVQAVRSWLGQVLEGGASGSGSLAYRTNRRAIWRGGIPEKYTRLVDLVPGQRVLELGAAEGVLSLLLAQKKEKVFALELKEERHEEAQRLKVTWQERGLDVGRCEMVLGNIKDQLHLLKSVDTLLAVRSIYYLRADLIEVFDATGRHVPNVVLCGNRNRARKYARVARQSRRSAGEVQLLRHARRHDLAARGLWLHHRHQHRGRRSRRHRRQDDLSGELSRRFTGSPSLADVERVAVLQVEMKMGPVHVIGLRAEHRGELIACAPVHAAEELRLWQG